MEKHLNRSKLNDETVTESNRKSTFNKVHDTGVDSIAVDDENANEDEKLIRLENATAAWGRNRSNQMNGIFDVNVEIRPGLCAVVGEPASCKSTLLNVILGELELDVGWLKVNGSISYASQKPWLFDGSVRDNIVFVEDFDESRYDKVVEVCGLEQDFNQLPQGDATIIGELGFSLNTGQRARVNLARAIYKPSDIYLLDDPLSAMNSSIGKHIFKKCMKEFLADKICVLATHQLQFLRKVNHVILMKNGKVEAQGPFQRIQKLNKKLLMYAQEQTETDDIDELSNRVGCNVIKNRTFLLEGEL